jgi:hypothetical protein
MNGIFDYHHHCHYLEMGMVYWELHYHLEPKLPKYNDREKEDVHLKIK